MFVFEIRGVVDEECWETTSDQRAEDTIQPVNQLKGGSRVIKADGLNYTREPLKKLLKTRQGKQREYEID